jgi:hypothetical protein
MASIWEMASLRVPDMMWRPFYDFVFQRGGGDGAVGMTEFNSVRDDLTLGVTLD